MRFVWVRIYRRITSKYRMILGLYQHQAQVVARRELLVDVAERRRQVEAAQEQPNRDRLAA